MDVSKRLNHVVTILTASPGDPFRADILRRPQGRVV